MLRNCPENQICAEDIVVIRFFEKLEDNPNNLSLEDWVNKNKQPKEYKYYDEIVTVEKSQILVGNKRALKLSDEKYQQYWIYIPIDNKILTVYAHIFSRNKNYISLHKNDVDQILYTFKFLDEKN